jgi:hypothetical protein
VTGGASPPPVGDAPLHLLSRDALSAFLYAALLPEEAAALVKSLRLSAPGFRSEGLSDVERCDLLADELRAAPASRQPVLEALRRGLKEPAFARSPLDPLAADELLEVAGSDHGLAIALWRLVADPQPEVRAKGEAALEQLAAEWYGPAPREGEGADPGRPPPPDPAAELAGKLRTTEQRLARAEGRAEEARRQADASREKLQAQLKEARAEAARAVAEAARAREQAEQSRLARERAEGELGQARATDLAGELQRLRGAAREADTARHAAEGRCEKLEEQVARLEAAARRQGEAREGAASAPPAQPEEVAGEPDEAPAGWLLPVFTQEFYDSLRGWDRRIQRAAVKQAFLLAQDHRHPSLRALPLGGIPGYYRVRVATDVRLIYRRDEARQDAVEILSVIDREDLDRYVRQAKTRQGGA